MTQEQKKFEEVTLYNFTSLRSPQNREKDDEDMQIDFIYCDLIYNIKDKSLINDEVSKIVEAKEVNSYDELYYNINVDFSKIIDIGKILNEYRYKEINLYKIHKKLQQIEYSDEELVNTVKRITWKSLVNVTKNGGELKLKEALINILRIYHVKKHIKLISDPEYKEDIPFFKRLIDAQVVIPKELFPKEETFFFGEKIKQYQVDPNTKEVVEIDNEILTLKNKIEKFTFDEVSKAELLKHLNIDIGIKSVISKKNSNNPYKTPFFSNLLIQDSKGFTTINFDESFFSKTNRISKIEITLIKDTIIEIKKTIDLISNAGVVFDLTNQETNKIIASGTEDILLKGKIELLNNFTYFFETKLNLIKPSKIESIIEFCGEGILVIDNNNDYYGQAFAPSGYGVKQLGILEYRKVTSTISRYVPAEVAKIENVMASEYRELATVKELTKEVTDFENSETSNEKENETVSTDRFQMQNEISKIFDQQNKNNFDTKYNYNGGTTSLDISFGTSTINSKNESNKQAVTIAKEVTNKAVEKIFSKVRKERTVKVTEKFTESSKHGFDNRGNQNHVSGVYRHINAVYKNQIYNYGRRLLYEFAIPEPALFHILLTDIEGKYKKIKSKIIKPLNPETEDGISENNIDNYNVLDLQEKYNIVLPTKPNVEKYLNFSKNSSNRNLVIDLNFPSANYEINVPNGYYPYSVIFSDYYVEFNRNLLLFYLGDTVKFIHDYKGGNKDKYYLADIPNNSEVFFDSNDFDKPKVKVWFQCQGIHGDFRYSAQIKFLLKQEMLTEWKKECFKLLKDNYKQKKDEYDSEIENLNEEMKIEIENRDNSANNFEEIINVSIKKSCLEYLISESTKNSIRKLGINMISGKTDISKFNVNQNLELDEYTAFCRFLEQAFDWNLINYNLYPYYWGDKLEWEKMYNRQHKVKSFEKFLKAGMARVVVSVRPGFEKAIMQYMLTGKIWEGGEVPTYGSSMFLSIAAEMKESADYKIEETWETVLPTNLIALQSSGVAINQEGLPNLENSQDLGEMVDNPHKLPKRKKFFGLF